MRLIAMATVVMLSGCLAGCAANTEAIERMSSTAIIEIAKPAVLKALDELQAQTGQIQGQVSLISPEWRGKIYAVLVNGVMIDFEIGVGGVSANIAGATQASAQPGPAKAEPATGVVP
jgi:hypothetical protein